MVTTVTDNSPQSINTSLFSLEKITEEKAKLLNEKLNGVNSAIAEINKILDGINKDADVVSVNGKQGIVTLDASDIGGLATVATSGNYNDLSNKPSIPAAQVNSDWNATSGVARILNKPSLATVATSGSYNDLSNKPTIPSVVDSVTEGNSNAVTSNAVYDKTLPLMGPRVKGPTCTSAELCNYIVNNGVATACCSSANITDGPNGNKWYNFLYIPHRNGIGGDNHWYGTLLLFEMTSNSTWAWIKHLIVGTWYEWKTLIQG